jgi:rubrerythrin
MSATRTMDSSTKPTEMGLNRTGIATAPTESKKTIEGAEKSGVVRSHDPGAIEAARTALSSQSEPVGTMPPPGSLKGIIKAGAEAMKGRRPTVFLDLLGDRLAFERTGVRIYEAFAAKLAAADPAPTSPTRAEVEVIRDQELQHVAMLTAAIESLGADPTVMTPTADICALATSGILKVMTDARSTLTHALQALHLAELSDNEAWVMLADLAEELGHDEMSASFRLAVVDESKHLDSVHEWLLSALEAQAGIQPSMLAGEASAPAP